MPDMCCPYWFKLIQEASFTFLLLLPLLLHLPWFCVGVTRKSYPVKQSESKSMDTEAVSTYNKNCKHTVWIGYRYLMCMQFWFWSVPLLAALHLTRKNVKGLVVHKYTGWLILSFFYVILQLMQDLIPVSLGSGEVCKLDTEARLSDITLYPATDFLCDHGWVTFSRAHLLSGRNDSRIVVETKWKSICKSREICLYHSKHQLISSRILSFHHSECVARQGDWGVTRCSDASICPCLSHCSIVGERHHDQDNSYKRKPLTVADLQCQWVGPQSPWWEAGSHAESFTSWSTGSRQKETHWACPFTTSKPTPRDKLTPARPHLLQSS